MQLKKDRPVERPLNLYLKLTKGLINTPYSELIHLCSYQFQSGE